MSRISFIFFFRHGRDWRYHKVDRIWIRRYNYNSVIERTKTFEKGLYNVFDPIHWRKVTLNDFCFHG